MKRQLQTQRAGGNFAGQPTNLLLFQKIRQFKDKLIMNPSWTRNGLFFILAATLVLSARIGLADTISLALPNGYSTIGDPLDNSGGHWPAQMNPSGGLDGSLFYKWNCNGWTVYTFDSSMVTGFADQTDTVAVPAPVMAPGEGALFLNNVGTATTVTFTGTPTPPVLPVPLPCGCGQSNLLTLQTTGSGTYAAITGLSPQSGAQVIKFNINPAGAIVGYVTNTFASGAWFPSTPSLTNGEAAFFIIPCATNSSCITLTCAGDKTVPCGTNWNFDAPTNIVDVCCTNFTVSFTTITMSNSPCSLVSTRTWLISDPCGNSNTCSQTVTVSPPSSYTITLQPGLNLIANQLDNVAGNSVTVLFPNSGGVRDGDGLRFWKCGVGYVIYYFDSASPTGMDDENGVPVAVPVLSPGMGTFYDNQSGVPETITFTGTPRCPPPTPTLCPCGTFSLVSYELDCFGTYQNITGLQPLEGSQVQRWNGTNFINYTFTGGAWTPAVPVLNVGEAARILVPCPTNCCDNCTTNNYVSYTVHIATGYNYLANLLCQGTNNLLSDLLPNVPNKTTVSKWLAASQSFILSSRAAGAWSQNFAIGLGEGFILNNPGAPYDLTISGCEVADCPLPCLPDTNGCVLVGRHGIGPAAWTNLSSCPPICGTEVNIWNGTNYDSYDYINGVWQPSAPVLGIGQSAFVCLLANTNPCALICSSNRTVQCGSNWSFDPPVVPALCGGTNVHPVVLNTVTSGVGYLTFNGGGSVANGVVNFVGNTAVSGQLTITAGSQIGTYTLNSSAGTNATFGWDNQVFPGTDPFLTTGGLLFTNAGTEINLWGDAPGSYSLFGTPPNFSPAVTNGAATFSVCSQTYTRTWLYVDGCGNSNVCSQTVTVIDTTRPLINCVSNKQVECGTAWTFDRPTVSDACCTNVAVSLVASNLISQSACQKVWQGIWQAIDCCSNVATCTQTVFVVDTTPPNIFCPTNIVVPAGSNGGAVVTYDVTATDLCSTNVIVVCTPPSGTLFPCGTNVVRCTATDACGKTNFCSFQVVVVCECLSVANEQLACVTNGAGQFTYSFSVQNNTGVPVKYLYLVPGTNCFTFAPDIVTFKPLLQPGQTTNVSVSVTASGACASNLCFTLAAHDSNFVQCCSITHCVNATVGPQLVAVTPICGSNQITVTFSSPLDPATQLGAPNFIVDDLTHHVTLAYSSASFGADLKTVNLFTVNPLSVGTEYQLTVNNVKDACGNSISPNSQLSFCCPYPDHRLLWTFTNGQLCLSWVCDGVLESSSSLNAPVWVPTPSQANPQCFVPGPGQKFFRLRQ